MFSGELIKIATVPVPVEIAIRRADAAAVELERAAMHRRGTAHGQNSYGEKYTTQTVNRNTLLEDKLLKVNNIAVSWKM